MNGRDRRKRAAKKKIKNASTNRTPPAVAQPVRLVLDQRVGSA